jgi:hypothetical protein
MRASKVRMHASHRGLTETRTQGRARVDAIVVPAARPARHLDFAINLANQSRAMLVLLCSRGAKVDDVRLRVARSPGTRAMLVEVPPGYAIPGFQPLTSDERELVEVSAGRTSDLSVKRNVGLLLARMLGWDNVVYLDDDIYRVTPASLEKLVGQLGSFPVAGMASTRFPDNSVVCHANRASGKAQDVMVSGSVLAVDCARPSVPFFPQIYNEDWFFFHEFAARRRLGLGGESHQLSFDPFEDPARAAREEFGDLLAEGLFAFLENHGPLRDDDVVVTPGLAYWDEFRQVRQDFIDAALRAFDENNTFDSRAVRSLESAKEQLGTIRSEQCVRFFDLMAEDRGRWNDVFKQLPTGLRASEALDRLQLRAADRAVVTVA